MSAGALARTGEMPEEMPSAFIAAAARYVNDGLTLEEVAAVVGVDVVTVEDWLRWPTVAATVDALAIEQRASGQVARGQSVTLLTKTVAKLNTLVETGELSAGTLVRVAEMAARVSGVVAEKPAPTTAEPKFTVTINLDPAVIQRAKLASMKKREVIDV